MTSPLPLPDWVPWWVHLAILLVLLFFVVMYLFLPFSVFGVKGRLEAVEARLDEIQGEIRSLALRLPEQTADNSEVEFRNHPRPPIPPAPIVPSRVPLARGRTEPRLY